MIRKDFSAYLSGSGVPCIWEEGGYGRKGGSATLVANILAEKPQAICVPRTLRQCGQHALIPVRSGFFIIEVGFEGATQIWRILSIDELHITCELVQENINGKWSAIYAPITEQVSENMNKFIEAAFAKASDELCQKVYWAKEPRYYSENDEKAVGNGAMG